MRIEVADFFIGRLTRIRSRSRSVMSVNGRHVLLALGAILASCATAETRDENRSSGFFHWQINPDLILQRGVTAGQARWGVRGSNPEPTDLKRATRQHRAPCLNRLHRPDARNA